MRFQEGLRLQPLEERYRLGRALKTQYHTARLAPRRRLSARQLALIIIRRR